MEFKEAKVTRIIFQKKWLPAVLSGLLLGIFAIIGSSLVGISYEETIDKIRDNERKYLLRQMTVILPKNVYDNNLLKDVIKISAPRLSNKASINIYRARKGNEDIAIIFSPVTANGYSGDIDILIGVYKTGELAGVRILKHKETPGLGDKIEEKRDPWITSFTNKSLSSPGVDNWKVKRDGGEFDQFTGATITPRAVVLSVKKTLQYFNQNQDTLFSKPSGDSKI